MDFLRFSRWVLAALLPVAGLWPTGPAFAEEAPAPYRGSRLTLRSATTAVSFNKGSQLSYDPYVGMTLSLQPRWWLLEKVYTRARFDLSRELTNSNLTTRRGETLLGDLQLGGGMEGLYRIPKAEVDISAELMLRLPTSKASRARTLVTAIEPSVSFSRGFQVLHGLQVGYGFGPELYLHRYTTAQQSESLIPDCGVAGPGCERFFNTGERNAKWGQNHSLDVGLKPLPWLSVAASAGLHVQYLYAAQEDDPRITHVAQEPTGAQYAQSYLLEASAKPHPTVTLALGASTFAPQRRPDSSHYAPLFNRFTQVYLDVRLDAESLVSLVRRTLQKSDSGSGSGTASQQEEGQ